MKIGIYNRWLATLGGGEKYSLTVAEVLSQRHAVTVISHKAVDRKLAATRLKIDLSRVELMTIPADNPEELEKLTGSFDFFFNASFMDLFPAKGARNILIVYFPASLKTSKIRPYIRKAATVLKNRLLVPTFADCLFDVRPGGSSYLFELGPVIRIHLPSCRRDYGVRFRLFSDNLAGQRVTLTLNGRALTVVDLPGRDNPAEVQFNISPRDSTRIQELLIQGPSDPTAPDQTPPRILLTDLKVDHYRFQWYEFLFSRVFKPFGIRLHRMASRPHPVQEALGTYDAIWAISKYTQKWIWNYWNRPSEILYPPVDVDEFWPKPKKNRILTVGRFFAGGHNKKHLELVSAFKGMVDQGLSDWEFHLAGGTTPGAEHERYLQRVQREASGYPIVIHPDIPHPQLVSLYEESALYWHASGYGENEKRNPVKFEHFGITTVEAMAAGCVPVILGKAGQLEIVRHGGNGYQWNQLGELQRLTWQLIRDGSLRERLALQAVADSRFFDKAHFRLNLHKLLSSAGLE